jgi:hypothetical protein
MLDDLDYDDSDSPAIAIAAAGTTWQDVQDHVKIAHTPLVVQAGDDGGYAGAYWASTRMVVVDDLGPDLQDAVAEFRDVLRERGEA